MAETSRLTVALLLAAPLLARGDGAARAEQAEPQDEIEIWGDVGAEASLNAAARGWERSHPGARTRVTIRDANAHFAEVLHAVERSDAHVPDVVLLYEPLLRRFRHSKEDLRDLGPAPFGAERQLREMLPFAVSEVRFEGRVVALPVSAGAVSLLCRESLLRAAGVRDRDLTASWEAFVEAGQQIKERTGAFLIPDVRAIAELVLRDGAVRLERVEVRPSGATFDDRRFRRALELARRVRSLDLDADASRSSEQWLTGLRQGTIACVPTTPGSARVIATRVASEPAGAWRVVSPPGGRAISLGGSYLGIPARAEHPMAAWSFIRFMGFEPEQQIASYQAGGEWPVLRSVQFDARLGLPVPALGEQRAGLVWRRSAAEVVPRLPPDLRYELVLDAVRAELEQVLAGKKTVDEALGDAKLQVWSHRRGR